MKISSLPRIHILNHLALNAQVTLNQDQTHYLTSVIRLKIGRQIRVFNQLDGEFIAKIVSVDKKSCLLDVVELFRSPINIPYICLAQSIIKNDRMMQALSMATQLGVTEIAPIITERVQVPTLNHERVMRVLVENAEQSERLSVPNLYLPESLESFIEKSAFDLLVYANENEVEDKGQKLLECLRRIVDNSKVAVLIGPEGGFTDSELEMLSNDPKAHSLSLGKTVLRAETAAAALLALIQAGR